MTMDLGTQDEPKLLVYFSTLVRVTASPISTTIRKKPLFFVLQASVFGKAEGINFTTPPYKVSPASYNAMQKAGIHSSGITISRISFQLQNHGKVFMPPIGKHPFTPISDDTVQHLANLQSLSEAKNFCIYISGQTSTVIRLWKRIIDIRKGTFTGDFTTQSVYNSDIVCDLWTNFNPFRRQKYPAKCQDPPLQDHQGNSAIDLIVSDSTNITI